MASNTQSTKHNLLSVHSKFCADDKKISPEMLKKAPDFGTLVECVPSKPSSKYRAEELKKIEKILRTKQQKTNSNSIKSRITPTQLHKLTLSQLRTIAAKQQIPGRSNMNKNQLIHQIINNLKSK